jgi:hypothetical protein
LLGWRVVSCQGRCDFKVMSIHPLGEAHSNLAPEGGDIAMQAHVPPPGDGKRTNGSA